MRKIYSVGIILVVIFSFFILPYSVALGASDSTKKPKFPRTQAVFSDKEILHAEYSSYKYPSHFYREKPKGSIVYVREYDPEESAWTLQVCTDDKEEALALSKKYNQASSVNRDLVKQRKTEKYFEFTRVNPKYPTNDIILERIHRCSYIDRTAFNMGIATIPSMLGVFNKRPITKKSAKKLIEYLWFIDNYNVGGSKVLTSFTKDKGDFIEHIMYELTMNMGDYGTCDEITLLESHYTVQKESGEIMLAVKKNIRTINGVCSEEDA